jgi:thioredoxin-like negative regulator of GroEL
MANAQHPVFSSLSIQELTPETVDQAIGAAGLNLVFFWGPDCPNCEQAKDSLLAESAEAQALAVSWYHLDAYKHMDVATRFGLHGIPTFLFFRDGRRLGRISPYPGFGPFSEAVRSLLSRSRPFGR